MSYFSVLSPIPVVILSPLLLSDLLASSALFSSTLFTISGVQLTTLKYHKIVQKNKNINKIHPITLADIGKDWEIILLFMLVAEK